MECVCCGEIYTSTPDGELATKSSNNNSEVAFTTMTEVSDKHCSVDNEIENYTAFDFNDAPVLQSFTKDENDPSSKISAKLLVGKYCVFLYRIFMIVT